MDETAEICTVNKGIELMLLACQAEGVKAGTVKWYRHRLARFSRMYGDRDVRSITLDDVRAYMVAIRALEFAAYSEFSLVREVRHLFKWLYEERRIDEPLYKRIKSPKLPQLPPKAVELGDVRALLKVCGASPSGKRDRAIVLFLLDTGCRVGGLCRLRVRDLDLKGGKCEVVEKGEKARTVLFVEETAHAVRAWLRARPFPGSECVFTSIRDGRPMCDSTVNQMLRRLKKRAGVEGRVNPHAFRHAFAREFILSGGDIGTVSQILGHTQISVTKQFYAMFSTGELKGEHDRFSPVFRLNGGGPGRRRR